MSMSPTSQACPACGRALEKRPDVILRYCPYCGGYLEAAPQAVPAVPQPRALAPKRPGVIGAVTCGILAVVIPCIAITFTTPAAVLYMALMFLLFVLVVVHAVRYRRRVGRYLRYGLIAGIVLIGMQAVRLVLARFEGLDARAGAELCCADVIGFVQMALFAAVGMHCAAALGLPHLAFLRRRGQRRRLVGDLLLPAGAFMLLAMTYSAVLFWVTSPEISAKMQEALQGPMIPQGYGLRELAWTIIWVAEFGLAEEVLFRLGAQNLIARMFGLRGERYWLSIALTGAVWSLAHVEMLDPNWVKIAQVFPVGLALGALFRRYGAETCIVAHMGFNVLMVLVTPLVVEI